MDEIAEMTPRYAGISHERIGRKGLQWPVAEDGTDTPILYETEFALPGGRGQFAALPYKPPGDSADDDYPFILVTGRRLEHYNAGTMTRRTGNLQLMSSDWLEVHPDDAAELGLGDGETVRVRSRRGEIELPLRITARIEPGHVFTAFHFPEVRTNLLIGQSSDVNTSCPEYKVVAVAIEPVGHPERQPRAAEPAIVGK
jgi:predicted molibdopterin-dependent oxidoreductase YjgC